MPIQKLSIIGPAFIAAATLMFAGSPVFAQDTSTATTSVQEITVVSPYIVQKRDGARTSTGIPTEIVTATKRVGYSDLDLTTYAGATTLKRRISDAAKASCDLLETSYPLNAWIGSNRECVRRATDEAMAVADDLIAMTSGR